MLPTDFGYKEPLELVRRDEQDRELHHPKDEVADHLLRRETDRLGYVVRNVEIRRPDGTDHLRHGSRAGIGLDSMPEECSHGTSDDGKPGKVPTEGGTSRDRIGNMKSGANETVEDEGNRAHETTAYDTVYGFAPIQET